VKLSHRMVKNFCGILSMSGKLDFPQLSEVNNSGVRVSVRSSTEPGQPYGMIVSAATSLWLPLPPQNVFNFFRDERTRVQVHETSKFILFIFHILKQYALTYSIYSFLSSGMFSPVEIQRMRLHTFQMELIWGTVFPLFGYFFFLIFYLYANM
jgi:hypothetical protein